MKTGRFPSCEIVLTHSNTTATTSGPLVYPARTKTSKKFTLPSSLFTGVMLCSVAGPPALYVRINAREIREGRKGAAQEQESSVLLPSYLVDLGICEASSQFFPAGNQSSRLCRGELHAEESAAWRPAAEDLESSDL